MSGYVSSLLAAATVGISMIHEIVFASEFRIAGYSRARATFSRVQN